MGENCITVSFHLQPRRCSPNTTTLTSVQVRRCRIIDVFGVCQPLHLAGSSRELTAITATLLRLLHSWAESSWSAVSARCWLMVYFQTFWGRARTNACENRHKNTPLNIVRHAVMSGHLFTSWPLRTALLSVRPSQSWKVRTDRTTSWVLITHTCTHTHSHGSWDIFLHSSPCISLFFYECFYFWHLVATVQSGTFGQWARHCQSKWTRRSWQKLFM